MLSKAVQSEQGENYLHWPYENYIIRYIIRGGGRGGLASPYSLLILFQVLKYMDIISTIIGLGPP